MGLADELKDVPPNIADDRRLARAVAEKRVADAKYKQAMAEIESLQAQVDLLSTLEGRSRAIVTEGPPKRAKGHQATAVLVLSDWHVEEPVQPSKVGNLNEFSLEIARKSAEQTFRKALLLLEDARQLTRIDRLVVACLGDFFSGWIHEELQEQNTLSPTEASVFAADLLEEGLAYLAAHSRAKRIDVVTANGNHGRLTKRMRSGSAAETSLEHLMYVHLARAMRREKRINWQVSDAYHSWLDIEGHACRFHHGDAIKYQGGVGGITIPVNKAVAQWNKSRRAAYDFFGHWHTWTHDWRWVCNGSLIGYSPYAVQIKADYQPPVQTFAVIDAEHGMTRALPVFCR